MKMDFFGKFRYFNQLHLPSIDELVPMTLDYIDLTYLIEGEMTYLMNGETIHLYSGDAILFPVGSTRVRPAGSTPVHYASINVIPDDSFVPRISGRIEGAVDSTVSILLSLFAREWNTDTPIREEQLSALFSYMYNHLLENVYYRQNPYTEHIKRYIIDHLPSALTISEIADAVHLTPEYCCAVFKKHTGKTLIQYITEQRIELAKQLLFLYNLPLQSVAEQVGYTDYSYLTRVFKKRTGFTPSEYRQRAGLQ